MAPIDPTALSSNWKALQKKLTTEKPPTTSTKSTSTTLKRKRSGHPNIHTNGGGNKQTNSSSIVSISKKQSYKSFPSRPCKKTKMEEPAAIGASKRHSTSSHTLSKAVSMPSLKTTSTRFLTDPSTLSEPLSVLAPHPDHPDIENEGLSETALPGKYIAVDCEMVGIGPEPDRDSQLARVSIVNYHGHQVYDSYVLPIVRVTDYRTPISGIEPKHLTKEVARPFKEVQEDIKILFSGRILIGHAIKNDLQALIVSHSKQDIRDTSRYSKFKELATVPGRTPALKKLVGDLLGIEIFQTGQHSSVEDARATMALFKLEKDGFEADIVRRYGSSKKPEAQVLQDGTPGKRKNKKKKKKKKN